MCKREKVASRFRHASSSRRSGIHCSKWTSSKQKYFILLHLRKLKLIPKFAIYFTNSNIRSRLSPTPFGLYTGLSTVMFLRTSYSSQLKLLQHDNSLKEGGVYGRNSVLMYDVEVRVNSKKSFAFFYYRYALACYLFI